MHVFIHACSYPGMHADIDACIHSRIRSLIHLSINHGPVVRSMVSANHCLSSIKINRLSLYLTVVSANQASSNSAHINKYKIFYVGTFSSFSGILECSLLGPSQCVLLGHVTSALFLWTKGEQCSPMRLKPAKLITK